jgi:hypothetical protein
MTLVFSLLPGCSTGGVFSRSSHKDNVPRATPANPVVRCLCLWEPGEGTGVDDKPARGVVGQVFFFTRDSVSSVAVDGDVRIFMFDDQGSEEEQSKPLHQFEFLSNTFQSFLRPTQFGPAYQLFVPYSRKGRHHAELAVRVRLSQPGAPPVFSELTKVTLPGHERVAPKSAPETPTDAASAAVTTDITAPMTTEIITPKLIEQTLLDVRSERQTPLGDARHPTERPGRLRLRQSLIVAAADADDPDVEPAE